MTGDSRDFLRLYADAMHNAHVLAGVMDFIDLGHAFNMTCELQQHIVSLISGRPKYLEAVIEMKRKGTNTSMDTEIDAQQNHDDQNSEVMGSENIENGEATNNSHHLCGPPNQVVNDTVPANSPMSSTCGTLTLSTLTSQEAYKPLSDKHKLIAIDDLCSCILDSGVTTGFVSDTTDFSACKLRNQVQYETDVTMVCAACPQFPRLCSAQCFRWWHNFHLLASHLRHQCNTHGPQPQLTKEKDKEGVYSNQARLELTWVQANYHRL
ncbi:unnamed protein product [Trichobilharzia regenti]|nr:unnamed protein product [Trichobilharzia regenti]